MTEVSEEKNKAKTIKKESRFFTKLIIVLAIGLAGYFGFKYWQINALHQNSARDEVQKFDNVESDIFDLAGSEKNDDLSQLEDLSLTELKEKGSEFIYQMLMKNQVQINDLREQTKLLNAEIIKHKNREQIGKMIMTYVELRQEIFAAKPFDESLKNFETLAVLDENLYSKVERLKTALPHFSGQEKLQKSFSALIPELITVDSSNSNPNLVSEVRRNISKLIIIRRIDEKDAGTIDSVTVQIERLLKAKQYQEALDSLLSLNQNYHEIIKDFLDDLSTAIEVQKIDQEILNYLKSLT